MAACVAWPGVGLGYAVHRDLCGTAGATIVILARGCDSTMSRLRLCDAAELGYEFLVATFSARVQLARQALA